MTQFSNDLIHEFPAQAALLTLLKTSNAAFHGLCERYQSHNKLIHKIESGLEAASDERLEDLKKQRLVMLDAIAHDLATAS